MRHILLVEDSAADVLMVREAVRHSGVDTRITISYDGEQALNLLDLGFQADLIILDLNLPSVSGFDILERHSWSEGPPIVVLTGSTNPEERDRALMLGAKDFLVKPGDCETYMATVRELIGRWTVLETDAVGTSF